MEWHWPALLGSRGEEKMAAQAQKNFYIVGNNALAQPQEQRVREREVSSQALANRERSLQMNFAYVMFLTIAAVITVLVCVDYLRLQARYTTIQKESTRLEETLGTLRINNDEEYNRIISSVNLEDVKETAIEKLGMVYASEEQIVPYDAEVHDYVRQFQELPD